MYYGTHYCVNRVTGTFAFPGEAGEADAKVDSTYQPTTALGLSGTPSKSSLEREQSKCE
jgi:hypothetical protein